MCLCLCLSPLSALHFFFVSSGSQEYTIVVNGILLQLGGWGGGLRRLGERLIRRDTSVLG